MTFLRNGTVVSGNQAKNEWYEFQTFRAARIFPPRTLRRGGGLRAVARAPDLKLAAVPHDGMSPSASILHAK